MGRDLAWLRLCIASYSRSPLTSPDVSLSLSLLLVLHLSSVFAALSLPSLVLAYYGTMRLRCANDRAADIGNYSLRDSRAPPPLLSLRLCAFVSYRPSLSFFHLLLLYSLDASSYVLVLWD